MNEVQYVLVKQFSSEFCVLGTRVLSDIDWIGWREKQPILANKNPAKQNN